MGRDVWSSRAYVLGEIVVSLVIIFGAFVAILYSADQGVKIAAGTSLGAVTTFWFSRRQAEQASNNLAQLADGKLTQLLESQAQQQQRTDAVVSLMGQLAAQRTEPTQPQ